MALWDKFAIILAPKRALPVNFAHSELASALQFPI
jgi:hypothetical protein